MTYQPERRPRALCCTYAAGTSAFPDPWRVNSTSPWQTFHDGTAVTSNSFVNAWNWKNGGVVCKMYSTAEAAYADLQSDNLDVLDQVPPSALAGYRSDLGSRAIDAPQGGISRTTRSTPTSSPT
ncbi:hypothetical protein OG689_04010 [Kitasatospora sp. NBC_00240]|uniref:hypothetical protein n=1 Tax=Kitasatospora sp. NBC_00240 TaxID=2903567 RepID=UPI002250DEB4|nr:hypothetical protein [Kitasatospora sp. NBC_00240]MCX5208467.1 hypothetical protein [Kitasatospora sp. NBC_00240]